MASDPNLIRASDQDRDRVANILRDHHAVGRLDADEFSERLDRAFAAKTMGDLEALTADLPAVDPYPLPTSSMAHHYTGGTGLPSTVLGAMSRGHGRFSPAWQAAWGSWLGTALLMIVIWGLTGAGYPWPLWVIGPWGAVMARCECGMFPTASFSGPWMGVESLSGRSRSLATVSCSRRDQTTVSLGSGTSMGSEFSVPSRSTGLATRSSSAPTADRSPRGARTGSPGCG